MKQSISYNLNNIVKKTGLKNMQLPRNVAIRQKDLVIFCAVGNE